MVQSTIGQSIVNAVGSIGGIAGRRAQDGLTAAQAESFALQNQEAKKNLAARDASETLGEMMLNKQIAVNSEGGLDVDFDNILANNPEALASVSGKFYNKNLTTTDAKGNKIQLEFAGVREVPAGMRGPQGGGSTQDTGIGELPTVGDQMAAGPEQEKQYMIMLRKPDGSIVPATQNATADPNDPLVIMSKSELADQFQKHVNHQYAIGGLGNNAAQGVMGASLNEFTEAGMRQAMLDGGADGLVGGDDVAKREFLALLPNLKGKELMDAAKEAGLDPVQMRVDAANAWTDKFRAENKKLDTPSTGNGLSAEVQKSMELKSNLLTQRVNAANKAIDEYDQANYPGGKNTALGVSNSFGKSPTASMRLDRSMGGDPKDPTRKKLVEARDQVLKMQENHSKNMAEMQAKAPVPAGAPMPKFEFTDENLRASIRGELEQPSPETTTALAKYAKEQGVTKAADIRNLPRERGQALAWVMSANLNGSATEKLAMFEKLSNFVQTGDTKRSAIQANIDISGAQALEGQVINQGRQVDASIANNLADNTLGWAKLEQDRNEFAVTLEQKGYDRASDVGKNVQDYYDKYTSVVISGAMGADPADPQSGSLSIKDTGPTVEMNKALNGLQTIMSQAPEGSPQQIAATQQFLEAASVYMASAAAFTGKPAWWDAKKSLTNFFLRENAVVPIGSQLANLKFDYKDGHPEKFRVLKGGPGSGRTEIIAGADTLDRIVGPDFFNTLEKAVTGQQAVNRLQKEGKPVTPASYAEMTAQIRKENGQ